MDRIVVCTETDIELISQQINQDLKDEIQTLRAQLAIAREALEVYIKIDICLCTDTICNKCKASEALAKLDTKPEAVVEVRAIKLDRNGWQVHQFQGHDYRYKATLIVWPEESKPND